MDAAGDGGGSYRVNDFTDNGDGRVLVAMLYSWNEHQLWEGTIEIWGMSDETGI